jgi:hypothetical protein
MRRTTMSVLIPLLAGLTLAASASAQSDPAFARIDSNHDARISATEYAAATLARFQQMDGNHDGQLTAAELAAVRGAMSGDGPDGDKPVDVNSLFGALDVNHDGAVSTAEMEAAHTRKPGQGAAIVPAKAPAAKVPTTLTGVAASLDGNHDGVISSTEYAIIGHTRFSHIDRNDDRTITVAEWQASHGTVAPAAKH